MNKTTSSEIKKAIDGSSSILLHLHPSPDGDSLGSSLALFNYLKDQNKRVTLIKGDSELPSNFFLLPGYDQITPKNLFEVNLSDYDLFISCDTSALNQVSKLGPVSFPASLTTVNIDHHSTNTGFAQISLIDPSSPATCQIIYQLLKDWHANITPQIAINLFIGLYTDSLFKYPKTTPLTFRIAAALVKFYPEFPKVIFEIENNNEPQQLVFRGLSLTSIESFFSGNLALSSIDYLTLQKHQIHKSQTEKADISNLLKSVVGWNIGASLVESEPGVCNLSLRTRDSQKFNLGKIAEATGAGGGHPAAAGATIYQPLPQAKKILLEIIRSQYPELGTP